MPCPAKVSAFTLTAGLVAILTAGLADRAAADHAQNIQLDISLFIGPDDCPGMSAFADPYVLQLGTVWYLTSTYAVGRPMYMFETSDWVEKKRHRINLDLQVDYLRSHFDDEQLLPRAIWGFIPYQHDDGSWHAYGTIHVGNFKTFVCHFQPLQGEWPVTGWRLDHVLVGHPSGTVAYESKVLNDGTGLYLVYVETREDGDNHIMVQRLSAPDEIDMSFEAYPILSPEGLNSEFRNGSSGMQICEGTNFSELPCSKGTKFVMLYSVGDFAESNYKLGVAYSDVLIPPPGRQYTKSKIRDAENIWENPVAMDEVVYLLQTQKDKWPNYRSDLVNGPGLGNLVRYQDRYQLVFHARKRGLTGRAGQGRWVWKCPVSVDLDAPSMGQWIVPGN